VGVGVFLEHADAVDVVDAPDGVAADADAGGLGESALAQLPDRLVSQRAGARDDADLAGLVNVTGHDADLAPRAFFVARRDDAGAVGTDETRAPAPQGRLDPGHVGDRNALGDRDHEAHARVGRFQNRVGGEGRWNENHGGQAARVGLGRPDGFLHRVKNGNTVDVPPALARRDAADHTGAVIAATLGVEGTGAPGDALHDDLGVVVDENAHDAAPRRRGHGFFRAVRQVHRRGDAQAGGREDLAALLDAVALEADHQGPVEARVLHGLDNALGDDVALHDAAENIDQDGFHVRVGKDDLEGLGDLLHRGAAPHVQKVRRLAPVQFDDVHGRHGQPGAVHEATDVAVQPYIGDPHLPGALFGVRKVGQIGFLEEGLVAEGGVVVQGDLGVHGQETAPGPLFDDTQRIHLDQARVGR
jgi:hypothetical protein